MKPNVIMVLADQLNAEWMGCAGHPQALTPEFDAFAASGMRFEKAYCQNPICTPSRVSILSGRYAQNHGYYGLSGPAPLGLDNLFRHFRRHGYRTAAYGKLHLPESPRNWIADDVDEFGDSYESADGTCATSEFLSGLDAKGLREQEDSWHNTTGFYSPNTIPMDARPSALPFEETQEMWCARKAMAFMSQADERPFCIQIAFQKPHHPLFPNERFWNLYPEDLALPSHWDADAGGRPPNFQKMKIGARNMKPEFGVPGESFEDFLRRSWRGTLACVSQIDHVFGLLLCFLKERGLDKNTIVILGSDHGAYHGHFGLMEKAPGICSDAVCRVPMIWKVPEVTPEGSVCSQLVENIDMAPTLAKLCGLPDFDSADGLDITPLLKNQECSVHEVALTENVWSKSIRWKNWRFVHYSSRMFEEGDFGELYNLEEDPWERRNLYFDPQHQDLVASLRRRLLEYLIETRRTVTTHVTVKNEPGRDCDPGARFTYPVCDDNAAPNPIQARNREKLNKNYL